MESANEVTGWRDAGRKCTGRDIHSGAACALIAGGMTARKTGALFAYRQVAGANLAYHLCLAVAESRITEDRVYACDYLIGPNGVFGDKMIF